MKSDKQFTEEGVREDLKRQPHVMMKLAENALTVAESLRNNYFKNTAEFIATLRKAMNQAEQGIRPDPILSKQKIKRTEWADFQGEVVSFIDGGVGQVELSSQVPILLRVGSYLVKTGERNISERENFAYYPVILGDLEGGSKERKDFPDIIRITSELLGGLSMLERTPDIRVLMFHGPLVYLMNAYAGHTPFTEKDIDLFLTHYASKPDIATQIKEDFLREAKLDIYPQLIPDRSDELVKRRLFEPLSWMSFLYRRLIREAKKRKPVPIIVGAVERGELKEFSERVLLQKVFRGLRDKNNEGYFNKMYGRDDLTSPKALLEKLNYTDVLLLSLLLEPSEFSDPWEISKYSGLRSGEMGLPNQSGTTRVNFAPLQSGKFGFPKVLGSYVKVSENTEPIRVEVFEALGQGQLEAAIERVYLYSKLLPRYGFPVGLDIADKFAHVPKWMTDAYGKLIRHHLGVSLQRGEISDAEMRKVLIQTIYMTHRDWLFRPKV